MAGGIVTGALSVSSFSVLRAVDLSLVMASILFCVIDILGLLWFPLVMSSIVVFGILDLLMLLCFILVFRFRRILGSIEAWKNPTILFCLIFVISKVFDLYFQYEFYVENASLGIEYLGSFEYVRILLDASICIFLISVTFMSNDSERQIEDK